MTAVAEVTVPDVTVNVAEIAPFATVTLAGTRKTAELELDSAMTAPPTGATAVKVTVPVADCPLMIALGLTTRLLSAVGGGLIVTPVVVLAPE